MTDKKSSYRKPSLLYRYEALRPFREHEIWPLFKYAAFGEALGWAFLLYGIAAEVYHMPGAGFALPIGGSLHGLGFLSYAGIVLAGYPSLGWSRRQAVVGTLASVPPFGSLVFEMWASGQRQRRRGGSLRRVVALGVVAHGEMVLAVQTIDSAVWHVPGGEILAGETAEIGLSRVLKDQFQVAAVVGPLIAVTQFPETDGGRLEMIYQVTNYKDFQTLDLAGLARTDQTLDEIAFVKASTISTLIETKLKT